MKHLSIRIANTTTTYTALNMSRAAQLVAQHAEATGMATTYFVHDRNMNLLGWFDAPHNGITKWTACKA